MVSVGSERTPPKYQKPSPSMTMRRYAREPKSTLTSWAELSVTVYAAGAIALGCSFAQIR